MQEFNQLKGCSHLLKLVWTDASHKQKGLLILSLLFLVIGKISIIGMPIIFKECIDYLNQPEVKTIHYPLILISLYISIGIIGIALSEVKEILFTIVSQNFIEHISHQAFNHIQKLPLCFHEKKKKGGLARSLDRGIMAIEQIIKQFIYGILPALCEIILILVIIISLTNITYSFVFLTGIALYTLYTYILTRWRTRLLRSVNNSEDQVSDQTMDTLLNVDVVKAFANEDIELAKYDKTILLYKKEAIRCQKSLSFLNIGQQFFLSITLGTVLTLSLFNIFNKSISLGTFVMLNAYALQIFNPVYSLSTVYKFIRESIIAMEKMFDIFQIQDEFNNQDCRQKISLHSANSIEFKNIYFSYNHKKRLIEDFNLFIKQGQKIALVGYSGQGKSTIPKILLRLYEIQSGAIMINDRNVCEMDKRELRKSISYVSQDVILFNDTIYNNIGYGNPLASKTDIIKAAESANIHTFIMSLPEQYETIVGERGVKLSGGERQRIAIARTFLKNSSILILDEATSHLDNENERIIYNNINQKFFNKTIIIIAHRLSTIKDVDQIYLIHRGQIIDSGKHEELLNRTEIYQKLWNIEKGLIKNEVR